MKITNIIINFILENKIAILGYLFFTLAVPLSNVYLPYLYGQIISEMNESSGITPAVKTKLILVVVMWLVVQAFWASMNMIDSYFIPQLRSHIRKYIVDRVVEANRENYSFGELGWVLAEIVKLPDEVAHMFTNIRNHILPMIYLLTFSIGYYTLANPLLGAISAATIGCYIAIALGFSKTCNPILREKNQCHRDLHDSINDYLGNLLPIYTEASETLESSILDGYEKRFNDKFTDSIKCTGKLRFYLNITYVLLFSGINAVSFYLYSLGKIELNTVVTSLIISLELVSKMSNFVGSLDKIMSDLTTLSDSQQALDKLCKNCNEKENGNGNGNSNINSNINNNNFSGIGDIVFNNVEIKYNSKIVLDNFNYTFPHLSRTAIFGEIGSGKTSLIKSLLRLIPYSGDISIGNIDIATIPVEQLRKSITFVPQNPTLFNRTVYENISYNSNIDRQLVERVIRELGLDLQLDQSVGKYGNSLSGGQRQIVYLLRCLFKNTPIIILDEPTSNLDSHTKQQVLQLFDLLFKNKTVIIISHDQDILQSVDSTITLAEK